MKITLEFKDVSRVLGERLVLLAKEIDELEHFDPQNNIVAVAISKEIATKRFSFQEVLGQITKQQEAWDVKIISTEPEDDDDRFRW